MYRSVRVQGVMEGNLPANFPTDMCRKVSVNGRITAYMGCAGFHKYHDCNLSESPITGGLELFESPTVRVTGNNESDLFGMNRVAPQRSAVHTCSQTVILFPSHATLHQYMRVPCRLHMHLARQPAIAPFS